ncbi:transposase [Streptococcus pneumoniae]|nr:transposase [Streptococcus pneumoniae]
MHLTNKEILDKLLSYSQDLKHHYQLYQLLLFHFQNKESEKFFGLIEDNLKQVHPLFQTVFKTFLKDKEKIINALQLHYSNARKGISDNLFFIHTQLRKASCGTSTDPMDFMRFLPAFCFSRSLRLRETSPP